MPTPPTVVLVRVMLPVGVKVLVNVQARFSKLDATTTVWVVPAGWVTPLQSKAVAAQLPAPVTGGSVSATV